MLVGMKKRLLMLFAFVLLSSCGGMQDIPFGDDGDSGVPADEAEPAHGELSIAFIDVGQGDAAVIISPDEEAVLIDAGNEGMGSGAVLPYLSERGITSFRYAFATHYHADHIAGLMEVIRGPDGVMGTGDDLMPNHGVIDRGSSNASSEERLYRTYEAALQGRRTEARPGMEIEIGDVRLSVVAVNGRSAAGSVDLSEDFDENAASVVIAVEFGHFRALLTSDVTGGGLEPPYQTADVESAMASQIGDIDVLKVAHHGSRTSTGTTFLAATKPELAVISVGTDNDFGHPNREVLERLARQDVEVRTTMAGTIEIIASYDGDFKVVENAKKP